MENKFKEELFYTKEWINFITWWDESSYNLKINFDIIPDSMIVGIILEYLEAKQIYLSHSFSGVYFENHIKKERVKISSREEQSIDSYKTGILEMFKLMNNDS